ncbi:hypothetical protein GCM10023329_29710 [Streptomyces sanyensis]|uniref:Insertion element IS402-like domain-containing protein n=1 Tax=Streptomyces sanyensis TaxID=568869 RepID=A0ABP9ACJ6_9ACTN
MPRRQRPYPSDLSDARWDLLEPTLTAWRAKRRGKGLDIGRPPEHDLRRIMDAILYVDRTGIPWRYLPHDFPPFLWNQIRQVRWSVSVVSEAVEQRWRQELRPRPRRRIGG